MPPRLAWIGPLLWVGWAMVLIPMLGVAALLHWLPAATDGRAREAAAQGVEGGELG